MEGIQEKVRMLFANTEKIIKGFAVFVFISCIIVAIFLFMAFLFSAGEPGFLIASVVLLVSSFCSFFIYGFGEIISQLRQINYSCYCTYKNSVDSHDKEDK